MLNYDKWFDKNYERVEVLVYEMTDRFQQYKLDNKQTLSGWI